MINIPLNLWAFDAAYMTNARQEPVMAKKSMTMSPRGIFQQPLIFLIRYTPQLNS